MKSKNPSRLEIHKQKNNVRNAPRGLGGLEIEKKVAARHKVCLLLVSLQEKKGMVRYALGKF